MHQEKTVEVAMHQEKTVEVAMHQEKTVENLPKKFISAHNHACIVFLICKDM